MESPALERHADAPGVRQVPTREALRAPARSYYPATATALRGCERIPAPDMRWSATMNALVCRPANWTCAGHPAPRVKASGALGRDDWARLAQVDGLHQVMRQHKPQQDRPGFVQATHQQALQAALAQQGVGPLDRGGALLVFGLRLGSAHALFPLGDLWAVAGQDFIRRVGIALAGLAVGDGRVEGHPTPAGRGDPGIGDRKSI